MRRDYVNPKKKIRNHLKKRKTSYNKLYGVFVIAVLVIGVMSVVLQTGWQSEASEIKTNNEVQENQVLTESVELSDEVTNKNNNFDLFEESQLEQSLFPKTKKEILLEEMIEKEGVELTTMEEQYFKTH